MINYRQLAIDVEDGNEDPLKAVVELTKLFNDVKDHLEYVKEMAIDEATKHEKSFEMFGAKFEQRNGSTRYSFKGIPEWERLNQELKNFESKSKDAFKARANGFEVFNTEDGTEVQLPTVSTGKDILTIKILSND